MIGTRFCPRCHARWLHAPVRREIPDAKLPAVESTHVGGGVFVVTTPLGYEYVGECCRCGVVREVVVSEVREDVEVPRDPKWRRLAEKMR